VPDYIDRAKQIRAIVEDRPGITSKELADEMGVTPGRVSQLVSAMRSKGDINLRKKGKAAGLHLSDSAMRRRLLRQRWTKSEF
jgi:Mn-dependent DtxR family transcriptional regulator